MGINKTQLCKQIANQTGLPKTRASKAVSTIIDIMTDALASNHDVKIAGFGKFYPLTLKRRRGRHPKTGNTLNIPNRRTVRFSCYKKLRNRVNEIQVEADAEPALTPEPAMTDLHAKIQKLPQGKAVVRISGIPVCDFSVRDISQDGTTILVENDSVVMRNIHEGMEIELHMIYSLNTPKTSILRSRLIKITRQADDDPYPGFVLIDLQTIDSI